MAVCCFRINSYIIWPWAVGAGLFVIVIWCLEIGAKYFRERMTKYRSKLTKDKTKKR